MRYAACTSSATLFSGLLEAFVERIADLLERVQTELDGVSFAIFPRGGAGSPSSADLHAMIQKIGANGDLVSKARESLVSFQRLLMYVQQATSVTLSRELLPSSSSDCTRGVRLAGHEPVQA